MKKAKFTLKSSFVLLIKIKYITYQYRKAEVG